MIDSTQWVANSYNDEALLNGHSNQEELSVADTPCPDLVQAATVQEIGDIEAENGSSFGDPTEFQADHDSGLESDDEEDMSVPENLYGHILAHGRGYHVYRDGSYLLPDDEDEQYRLHEMHSIWELCLNKRLYLAPISRNPHQILDMGTGVGIWANEVADIMPSAKVTGVDLSAYQPSLVAPNAYFLVDDLESLWLDKNHFDFIFGRDLALCFKDPYFVLRNAFEALKPGAYLELQNIILPFQSDDEKLRGTAFKKWMDLTIEGAKRLSRSWLAAVEFKSSMKEIGFEDIVETSYLWQVLTLPVEKLNKQLEPRLEELFYTCLVYLRGMHAISAKVLAEGMKMGPDQVEDLIKKAIQELREGKIRVFVPVKIVYGRKPD